MAIIAVDTFVMGWIVPVAIVVAATLAGWVVEQLAMRWLRSIVQHHTQRQQSVIAKSLWGHVTFWGFLLGVGLAYDTLITLYPPKPKQPEFVHVLFSAQSQGYIHDSLLALFVISLTLVLSNIIVSMIVTSSASASRPVVSLVTNVTRFVVLVIGLLLVLSVFQISITPWLTTLGVAGLAVSLALQATLTDFVSGTLLLASRQLEIGEYVKLSSGEEGFITDITWRTTTLRMLNNNIVIVPNSKMTSQPVTNYKSNTQPIVVIVEVGVALGSDLEQVERVTFEVAQDVMKTGQGGVVDFEPLIRFANFGDSSIRMNTIMQAKSYGDQFLVRHEFIKRLRARYDAEGIVIPYPIQRVQVEQSADGAKAQARAKSSEASSR
ncbi:MAG TPA: mechanosensitive ion channel family protein [Ktedonobacterales bacterium]